MSQLCCLKCSGTNFHAEAIKIHADGKKVKSVAWICDECGQPLMDSSQMQDAIDALNKAKEIPTESLKKEDVFKNRKQWRPNKMHPWKTKPFKDSIDKHVLNK